MPQPVQGPDGKLYQFPDGTTKDQAIAYFRNKGIGVSAPPSSPAAPSPSLIDRLTEIQKPGPNRWAPSEAGKAIGNIGAGGLGMILHPINTLESVGGMFTAPIEMMEGHPFSSTVPGQALKSLKENPLGTIEAGVGQAAVGGAGEAGLEAAPKIVEGVSRRAGDIIGGTGPRVTANLVKETREANKAEIAKTAEKNADIAAQRQVDLRKHFEKTQEAKSANQTVEQAASRKEALGRGVEKLDTDFRTDLKALRDRVLEQNNAKYAKVNAALDSFEADGSFLPDALEEASDKIKGSNTEPTILKDMEKKVSHGDVLSYRDMQGYYSEIGRELSKGTLPGDVFTAYKNLQEKIGNEMQRIADEHGMGAELSDARSSWRQMRETFFDPKSPVTKALMAKERGGAVAALRGKDITGIEALSKYDPELGRRANTIRGYQEEAKSIKPGKLKTLPKAPEKTPPVGPKLRTVGPEEIQEAKAKALHQRAEFFRHRGMWAATWPVIEGLRTLARGHGMELPVLAGETGATAAGIYYIAHTLENPGVVEALTKPTPRDIAHVTPNMARGLEPVLEEARKKGIKVSPTLTAVVAAALPHKKRVGELLAK